MRKLFNNFFNKHGIKYTQKMGASQYLYCYWGTTKGFLKLSIIDYVLFRYFLLAFFLEFLFYFVQLGLK